MSGFLTHPEEHDEERLRLHEADFTPRPVVRQCLRAAREHSPWRSVTKTGELRIVDGAAGAGVWAQEAWRMFPMASVVAVELREEETPHLMRHQQRLEIDVIIGDFFALSHKDMGEPDILATNPAFSRFCDYVDRCIEFGMGAWLYAPIDIKLRGAEGCEWWDSRKKWLREVLVTAGPVGFRGRGGGSDNRVMALWVFSPDASDRPTKFEILPLLEGKDRRWVTRPGTEGEG